MTFDGETPPNPYRPLSPQEIAAWLRVVSKTSGLQKMTLWERLVLWWKAQ